LITTARSAFRDGIRRVNAAPAVLAGMVLLTLLVALPLSVVLRGMLAAQLGSSAAAETARGWPDYDWWQEFSAQASGVGATFSPSIIGFAAVLDNTSAIADNRPAASGAVAGATLAWLALWSFLSGGILDRYARQRPTRSAGFFAACGTHFWRFLRLGVAVWLVHLALFGIVHGWIFDDAYARLTRDVAIERVAFALRLAGYVLFTALLAAASLLFDFARVRIVVEDRRSALGALAASGRFLARHAPRVAGLFALNALAWLALAALYAALSTGAARTDIPLWLGLGLGQAYIIGRHYLKLLVYASETSLFQGALAHAAYTAAPVLVWPDSPAVETITNTGPAQAG
jgi:hypothetical protein